MLCSKKVHYDALVNELAGQSNIKFMLENGKGHNPNYTLDAVAYLGEYINAKNKLTKQKKLVTEKQKEEFLATFDWDRMTSQDEKVWNAIFEHLES
jgi:hypothetical protein